ncbi:hypothetical protein AO501_12540 [Mycobacterium gordonae]|uniref:Uncharacterized protein n=1 Tax=Mycobacterium gordonae TaxID=1778 RepID=A0A0Q2R7I9_MYCGO|nr:hypothetical protein [Mycobacterium gordonae]KQH80014.1 hypothetical protein AO501_12540 [Mycobacterium gordonae]
MNVAEHTTDPWTSTDHDPHQRPAAGSDCVAENIYADWDLEIRHHRQRLLASLTNAVSALGQAAGAVNALLSEQVYDVEFTEAGAGEDIAAFTTESLRLTRAAYALTRLLEHATDRF